MHLRSFQRQDIPTLVSMTIECDKTDALANFLIHDADRYPVSHRRGIHHFIRSKVTGGGRDLTFVLETDPDDYGLCDAGKKEVIGVATWRRHGISLAAQHWQSVACGSVLDRFNCLLISLEDRYNAFFPHLNPCFNKAKLQAVCSVQNEEWNPSVFKEFWSLEFLQVSPEWQRKGLSKILLGWGFDQARSELVPIVVSASPIGNFAYRSAGFESIGFCGYEEYFEETRFGGERMQLWVWEPVLPVCWGGESDWAVRAREKREEGRSKAPRP